MVFKHEEIKYVFDKIVESQKYNGVARLGELVEWGHMTPEKHGLIDMMSYFKDCDKKLNRYYQKIGAKSDKDVAYAIFKTRNRAESYELESHIKFLFPKTADWLNLEDKLLIAASFKSVEKFVTKDHKNYDFYIINKRLDSNGYHKKN